MNPSRHSRRDFFSRIGAELGEKLRGHLPRSPSPSIELQLGRLMDFEVGQTIRLETQGVEVISLETGLQARTLEGNRYLSLRIDPRGMIWANPDLAWEPDAVLCLMTGEKRTLCL